MDNASFFNLSHRKFQFWEQQTEHETELHINWYLLFLSEISVYIHYRIIKNKKNTSFKQLKMRLQKRKKKTMKVLFLFHLPMLKPTSQQLWEIRIPYCWILDPTVRFLITQSYLRTFRKVHTFYVRTLMVDIRNPWRKECYQASSKSGTIQIPW